jgi:hypothetical protein
MNQLRLKLLVDKNVSQNLTFLQPDYQVVDFSAITRNSTGVSKDDMQARGHEDTCGDMRPAFVEISLVGGVLTAHFEKTDTFCRRTLGRMFFRDIFQLKGFA